MTIKRLKKGDFFVLKASITDAKPEQVWIKDDYDRKERRYLCHNFADVNRFRLFKSDREIYTEFIF